ncbi:aquaporin-7 isoform X3 [Piliocolobus tephrosceles]|uniref:aquaporin-7 isoform X3 n=1 Tax=Piliocolobus tephrosceles TaxID=591936 RepID=UPI000C2B16C8|nr:aquaporin-7 isoform X3 [Piliocolobus tephrosceles]
MVSWSVIAKIQNTLQKKMVREFLAEFMSTYVMMVFGLGSVAHMVLSKKYGSYLGVNLGFGFGVTMGVHVAGHISGAHMNAAVTFANCALGRVPWRKFPVYVLGQFLGSFLAAATIYTLFYTAILHFSGGQLMVTGPVATAGIFATYLPDHMTLWRGFLNEAWLTGMLQLCLFAITDQENNPALPGTQALVIGILVVIIGVSLGMNTGYAINPSRDLPPRVFTFIAGWGKQVFRYCPCPGPFLRVFLWFPCVFRGGGCCEGQRSRVLLNPQVAWGAGVSPNISPGHLHWVSTLSLNWAEADQGPGLGVFTGVAWG